MANLYSWMRIASLGILLTAGGLLAADGEKPVKADNTKMNKSDAAMSADSQKMNSADRELAQKVRKAIMADKSLSTYAHNVKVIARDGMVTLKGPVRSEDEKTTVAAKAAEAVGADRVTNELTVAPKKS